MKSKGIAYLLWFFLGWLGVHRFYLGKIGTGILYLFTFGVFGIGWFVDLFLTSSMVDTYNALHASKTAMNNMNMNNIVVNVNRPQATQPQTNQPQDSQQQNANV